MAMFVANVVWGIEMSLRVLTLKRFAYVHNSNISLFRPLFFSLLLGISWSCVRNLSFVSAQQYSRNGPLQKISLTECSQWLLCEWDWWWLKCMLCACWLQFFLNFILYSGFSIGRKFDYCQAAVSNLTNPASLTHEELSSCFLVIGCQKVKWFVVW